MNVPIKVKAMCIFVHEGRTLAQKGYDPVKDAHHFRLIGGNIEYGEAAEVAVRREILEEVGSEIEDLEQVGAIENIFTYNGEMGHEVVFLFTGKLAATELYSQEVIPILDMPGHEAVWIPVEEVLSGRVNFYPPFDYSLVLKDN